MKKFIKNNTTIILGIIIGIVVSIGGVYATGQLTANDIELDKTNGKLANISGTKVQDALEYLYDKASNIGGCPDGYICNKSAYLPASDNNAYTQSTFVQNLKVGDLIKMTPSGTSFQTDGSKTGSAPQTINPQELQYWRVINRNDNGTIDVVSEYVSSVAVYFRGVPGYANFIGYLNELASYYENPNYTIGSRYMGYDGQTEYIQNLIKFNGTINGALSTTSTASPETGTGEEYSDGELGDTLYLKDYQAVKEDYGGTTVAKRVGSTGAAEYWLASRYYDYSSSYYFYFKGRYVTTDGSLRKYEIRRFSSSWLDNSISFALRPILTLKADITSSSTESSTGAYILD